MIQINKVISTYNEIRPAQQPLSLSGYLEWWLVQLATHIYIGACNWEGLA